MSSAFLSAMVEALLGISCLRFLQVIERSRPAAMGPLWATAIALSKPVKGAILLSKNAGNLANVG
jgi:hypothetical protein